MRDEAKISLLFTNYQQTVPTEHDLKSIPCENQIVGRYAEMLFA
jgi:hypothetical protein